MRWLVQRRAIIAAQPEYRDTEVTEPRATAETAAFEVEYRAALELDRRVLAADAAQPAGPEGGGELFPTQRVLYDPDLQVKSARAVTAGAEPASL